MFLEKKKTFFNSNLFFSLIYRLWNLDNSNFQFDLLECFEFIERVYSTILYYNVLCLRLRYIGSFEASFCTIPSPEPANIMQNGDYNNIMRSERPEIKQNYLHFVYTCSVARDFNITYSILFLKPTDNNNCLSCKICV